MPGYFRFLTLVAYHAFLQLKVCLGLSTEYPNLIFSRLMLQCSK